MHIIIIIIAVVVINVEYKHFDQLSRILSAMSFH